MFFDALTRIGPVCRMHPARQWRLEQLQAEMAHCAVAGAMVASTLSVTYDPMLENRRLSAMLAEFPNLFPVWNVMPH